MYARYRSRDRKTTLKRKSLDMNFVCVQILKVTIHITAEYLHNTISYIVSPTSHKLPLIPLPLTATPPRIKNENSVISTASNIASKTHRK